MVIVDLCLFSAGKIIRRIYLSFELEIPSVMKHGVKYFFSIYLIFTALGGCENDKQAPSCTISSPAEKA
jgi:hypothetical protein